MNAKTPPIYAVFDGDRLAFSHAEIPIDLLVGEVCFSDVNPLGLKERAWMINLIV